MKQVSTIGIVVLLLVLAGYLFYDLRSGSAGVIVDGLLVVFMTITLIKRLRQRSDQLKH